VHCRIFCNYSPFVISHKVTGILLRESQEAHSLKAWGAAYLSKTMELKVQKFLREVLGEADPLDAFIV